MEKRTLYIGGGVAAAALLGVLYLRSRSSGGADEAAADDVMGGSTLLFTPPAALSAPGSSNWESPAATASGGSTSLASTLAQQGATEAQNALQLGTAAMLAKLTADIIAATPNSQLGQLSVQYVNGAFQISNTPRTPAPPPTEQWSRAFEGSVQTWYSRAGAVGTSSGAGVTVQGKSGNTYTGMEVYEWGKQLEAAGKYDEIYNRLQAEGISLDSYDALRGRVITSAADAAEQWAQSTGRAVF